jgi:hypothetical protein
MPYTKALVCLANSRKLSGRCVAGREWDGQKFGAWIRPIGPTQKGELGTERLYKGGKDPKLLDLMEVPLLRAVPVDYQSENHLVDTSKKWQHRGAITRQQLTSAVDKHKGPLWVNGQSTGNGRNDKLSVSVAKVQPNSLALIQPKELIMKIDTEGKDFDNPRRKVRGEFSLDGERYVLAVTDPVIEAEFLKLKDGSSRSSENPILCISVSEVFEKQNACYKLIAGVIEA